MRVVKIVREISHKLNVAKFESIMPTVRQEAVLDEGEDAVQAQKELNALVEAEWNLVALKELREVRKRRKGSEPPENDKLPELTSYYKDAVSG